MILMGGGVSADIDLAIRCEKAGFDSVFSIEFFNRHGYVPLGAIAQATERIRIGTGIANSFTRSPLVHASAAMDLDEISGGRMVLGLGSATRRMNQDWYGVPFSEPAKRTRELVELLRAAFAAQKGGGFKWDGEFWQLKVPMYSRPNAARESIPVWIAAVNRGMIRCAGEVADGLVGRGLRSGGHGISLSFQKSARRGSACLRSARASRCDPHRPWKSQNSQLSATGAKAPARAVSSRVVRTCSRVSPTSGVAGQAFCLNRSCWEGKGKRS